jgi:hypothetical protein
MSTVSPKNSRDDRIAADQKLIDGIQQNAAQIPPSFTVRSQTVTQADIVKMCEDRIATGKAARSAEDAHATAVKADLEKRVETRATLTAIKRILIIMFANKPDLLGSFGLKPPAAEKKTAATKAAAAQKARATRAADGKTAKTAKAQAPAVEPPAPQKPSA